MEGESPTMAKARMKGARSKMAENTKKLKLLGEFEEWVRLMEKIFELEREAASRPRSYATLDRPTEGDIGQLIERILGELAIKNWFQILGLMQLLEEIDDIPKPVTELTVRSFQVDIEETDDAYILEAELAGAEMDNMEIVYTDDILTISAVREEPVQSRSDNFIRRERKGGKLTRSFHIRNIVKENANASFVNGLLRVVLPKRRVAKEDKIPITQ
jgi:HSP20 family protein